MKTLAMKRLAAVTYGAALAAGIALALASASAPVLAQSPGEPGSVCLEPNQIRSTQVKDDKTIIFQMRNGDVWENTLVARCPGLKAFGQGIAQMVTNNRICSFQQRFVSAITGQFCRMGSFTRVK
jgi:hypothetical protein